MYDQARPTALTLEPSRLFLRPGAAGAAVAAVAAADPAAAADAA